MPSPPPAPTASPRSAARAALALWPAAVGVGLLALFPLLVTKPYPLHMGVILFLAVLQAVGLERGGRATPASTRWGTPPTSAWAPTRR